MSEHITFSNKANMRGGSMTVTILPAICTLLNIVEGDLIELEIKNIHKNNNGGSAHEPQDCDP